MLLYAPPGSSACSFCLFISKTLTNVKQVFILLLAARLACSGSAHAARPFVTDDARAVDAGGCQIESFAKQQQRTRLAAHLARRAGRPLESLYEPYMNLITSVSFRDDAVVLHANAGALNDRLASRIHGTWGLGVEILLNSRLYGIAESYGQKSERPSKQLGLRYWVQPNRFQIDSTLGAQRGRTWLSMGIRLLF